MWYSTIYSIYPENISSYSQLSDKMPAIGRQPRRKAKELWRTPAPETQECGICAQVEFETVNQMSIILQIQHKVMYQIKLYPYGSVTMQEE
jgi:hypothetical protein